MLRFLDVFYTVEAGRNDMIYFIIGANSASEDVKLCAKRIPEGNYSVVTLNNAIANIMSTGYLSSTVSTIPSKFVAVPSISKNKIIIGNDDNDFEILTDEQVLAQIYNGWTAASYPMNSINDMIQIFTPKTVLKRLDFFYFRVC